MNPFLLLLAPLALGYAWILAHRQVDRPALLALAWAAAASLPLVPALALAVARVAALPAIPRPLVWTYLACYLYAFLQAFPFVGFRCC